MGNKPLLAHLKDDHDKPTSQPLLAYRILDASFSNQTKREMKRSESNLTKKVLRLKRHRSGTVL